MTLELSDEQTRFLLWMLGYVSGAASKEMSPARRNYVLHLHDEILKLMFPDPPPGETPRCFAYKDDGTICGEPATHLHTQLGCMVCPEHRPPPIAPPNRPLVCGACGKTLGDYPPTTNIDACHYGGETHVLSLPQRREEHP